MREGLNRKLSSLYGAVVGVERPMRSFAGLLLGLALSAVAAGSFFLCLTKLIFPALAVGNPAAVVAGLSIFLGVCCLSIAVCGLAMVAVSIAEMVKDYQKLESANAGEAERTPLFSPASSAPGRQLNIIAERPVAAGAASSTVVAGEAADVDAAALVRPR